MADVDLFPEKKLLLGGLAGLAAAIVGAVIWAVITVTTDHQIGWMALGVGALVGFALRIGNGGKAFGILGALFALFGCVLGNYFSADRVCVSERTRWFFYNAEQCRFSAGH
jgi:hypothetical protein